MNIYSLTASAGLFGIDTSSLQSNADSLTAAAQAKKSAGAAVKTPWSAGAIAPDKEKLVRSALAGKSAIDQTGPLSSSASRDAQSLFKLYNGLQALSALAEKAALKTTSDFDRTSLQRAFANGVAEAQAYVDKLDLQRVTLVKGAKLTREDSALALARNSSEYVTGVIQAGAFEDPVASLSGDVRFDINIAKSSGTSTINFDLSEMGATPRTMQNVTDYINGKLQAAGVSAAFSAVRVGTPNAQGRVETDTFGFKIKTISSEKLSFSAPDAAPALVIAGRSGAGDKAGARLTKITNLSGAPAQQFASNLSPEKGAVTWRSTAVGPDGGYYAVGETTAPLDGTPMKSDRDAVLAKYDSTGKLLWTKTLGAAGEASAYSIAVSADGDVAVAGSTKGRLSADIRGGADAFVSVFDSSGTERWTRQTGTTADDKAMAVAFNASGDVVVAGSTKGAIVSGAQQGGSDSYLEVWDSAGALSSRRQFGSSGDDSATAIVIADDGQAIVAGLENGRGVLRKYDISAGAPDAPAWTQDLGDPGVGGAVSALAYKDGAIYVGGRASSGGMDAAQGGAAWAGGEDGWIARYDDGAGATKAWGQYVGAAGADQIRSISVAGGAVWATGDVTGQLPGGVQIGAQDMFAAKLDLATGAAGAVMQLSGNAGYASGAAVAIDPNGDSSLNLLGLPNGALNAPRSSNLTARSNVRPGDFFYVTTNNGAKRKVTIEAGDDWTDLSFKINAVIGLNGRAAVRTSSKGESLRVEVKAGSLVEFSPGESGRDALGSLGLTAGTVYNDGSSAGATSSSAPRVIALGLDTNWSLATVADAVAMRDTLTTVMRRVKDAYGVATNDPAYNPDSDKKSGKTGGSVPAYMTAQLQNYTAALQRLQSGG